VTQFGYTAAAGAASFVVPGTADFLIFIFNMSKQLQHSKDYKLPSWLKNFCIRKKLNLYIYLYSPSSHGRSRLLTSFSYSRLRF